MFPEANLSVDSLPRSLECFFIIKYMADKSRKEFGEHTDHTQLTINISLTNPIGDHTAGGLFIPTPKGSLGESEVPTPAVKTGDSGKNTCDGNGMAGAVISAIGSARRAAAGAVGMGSNVTGTTGSKGVLLRPCAGTAIMHNGNVRHAGDKIESGERMQLVAFFYGKERRGNALPLALPTTAVGVAKPSSAAIIAESWPAGAFRDHNGKLLKAPAPATRLPMGLSDKVGPLRDISIRDVAALARP